MDPTTRVRECDSFQAVLERRLSRRAVLQAGLAGMVLVCARPFTDGAPGAASGPRGFVPLAHSTEDRLIVPAGYAHNVLLRWGDPLATSAAASSGLPPSAASQRMQFGYNCDFVAFLPLPRGGSSSENGILVVNHEYTHGHLMFPDCDGEPRNKTRAMVDVEMAAHGLSIVAVHRTPGGAWRHDRSSPLNRRITADTPMRISGPAAGHPWLRTADDPAGERVLGTLFNCSGGVTPWGTVLSAEENWSDYFGGSLDDVPDPSLRDAHARYGLRDDFGWSRFIDRFDVAKTPHEPMRFGWVVEVDPYDPSATPVKRTALGRTKHEGANVTVARGGQVVIYSGDDERFEYLYKFVTARAFDPADRAAAADLLDSGTLCVARFDEDGSGVWLPLVHGEGPLTPANGFASQADVLIRTRAAADLLGATTMDRPEDVETSPITGKVYAVMSNNPKRDAARVNAANPREANRHGHIIEIVEEGGDHAATRFRWEILIACGDPRDPAQRADYQGRTDVSWFSCPDNVAFDREGRLWVATDGQPSAIEQNDALYVIDIEGAERGRSRMFLSGLPGGEVTGPAFTPDQRTLFVAIQHPGAARGATFANPASRFPDYDARVPPRPSVVAVYRSDGGVVGT